MLIKQNDKKRYFKRVLSVIAVACLLSITAVQAQEGPEPVGDGLDGETTTVPFDGGVSLLVAVAIVYGTRKKYSAKKIVVGNNSEALP